MIFQRRPHDAKWDTLCMRYEKYKELYKMSNKPTFSPLFRKKIKSQFYQSPISEFDISLLPTTDIEVF